MLRTTTPEVYEPWDSLSVQLPSSFELTKEAKNRRAVLDRQLCMIAKQCCDTTRSCVRYYGLEIERMNQRRIRSQSMGLITESRADNLNLPG